MKYFLFYILVFVGCTTLIAQSELVNSGNLYLHPGTQMGIHVDLYNEGNLFAQENTLVGFYGELPNIIDGTQPINFYDVEFGNDIGTFLRVVANVDNNANFVFGNIVTPFNNSDIFLNFNQNAFYTGETDDGKLIGFVTATEKDEFSFPVGDRNQLRPLLLASEEVSPQATCAYLRENPDSPSSISTSFSNQLKTRAVGSISTAEFWLLQSSVSGRVTLSWNQSSNLGILADDVTQLILVGFSKTNNQWIPISSNSATGDISEGIITSDTFVPDDYEAITFGSTALPTDTFAVNNPTLGEYFLSPNGDGINDFLVFDNLEDTGSNQVDIYTRSGQKVFTQSNYTNQFRGIANTGSFLYKQDIGLPEGFYYYTIILPDLGLHYQGFLFLDR